MSAKLKAGIVAGVAATMLFAAPAAANNGRGSGNGHFTVNTKADTTDAKPGDGKCKDANNKCSLRAAVQESNALAGPNSIKLGHGYYTLSLLGASEDAAATGDLDITSEISITGKNASVDLVGLGDRGFDIIAGASLNIEGVRVHNGTPPTTESGGAFRSAGTLNLFEVAATNNVVSGAGASGGAIANLGGKLIVTQSYLANNSATRAGGAIEAVAGTTVIERSLLTINSTGPTPGNGGALHLTGAGDVQVIDSLINSNVASAEGGGLWNSAVGTMTVRGTVLGGNVANGVDADQGGGALFNDGGKLSVSGSWITGNSAPLGSGSGGAIFNNAGVLSVTNTSLEANIAARAGGAIETLAGTVTVTGSNVASNTTGPRPGNGGGLHVSGAGNVTFESSNVSGNTAANEGGGLWNSPTGTMTVTNTTINDNTVGIAGNGPNKFQKGPVNGGVFTVDGTVIAEGPNTLARP